MSYTGKFPYVHDERLRKELMRRFGLISTESTTLAARVTVNEGAITTLSGRVTTNEDDIAANASDINTLEALIPAGSTTNAVLRWSGSAWVQNDNTLIDSDGYVGVGVAPDSSPYTLTVAPAIKIKGTTGGCSLTLEDASNQTTRFTQLNATNQFGAWRGTPDASGNLVETQFLTVDSAGRVGLGEESPALNLHISGTDAGLRLEDTSGAGNGGRIQFFTNATAQGAIRSGGTLGNAIAFYANGGANERMRINASGNVGINTDSPDAKFHSVAGSVNRPAAFLQYSGALDYSTFVDTGVLALKFPSTANTTYRAISFSGSSASGASFIDFVRGANSTSSELSFGTSNTERIRIDSAGSVGIGETDPDSLLHIKSSDFGGQLKVEATSTIVGINFQNTDSFLPAEIELAGDEFRFNINGSEQLSLDELNAVATFENRIVVGGSSPTFEIDSSGRTLNYNRTYFDIDGAGGAQSYIDCDTDASGNHLITTYMGSVADTSYMQYNILGNRWDFRIGGTIVSRLTTTGLAIGAITPTENLDINGATIRLRTSSTPASSGASGNRGSIQWDANYLYVATSTNTWKRVALSTF